MKIHQLRGLDIWEQLESGSPLGCTKRLPPPLPPNLRNTHTLAALDLKSFIKPATLPSNCSHDDKREATSPQSEVQSGGTRWNPTQEQIGILEKLYRGSGMRTPNAQQIEQITAQLSKFGKIEGKNVFYWFQNHKARERQKQKRSCLSRTFEVALATKEAQATGLENVEGEEESYYKKKCRSWGSVQISLEEERSTCGGFNGGEEGDKTLELFPLHPEGR